MRTFTEAQVARLIAAFDATGMHRASSPGDQAGGDWLAAEASAFGAVLSRIPVVLPRTLVEEAYVEVGGQRLDGLPMFDSPSTGQNVVLGALCAADDEGCIGYLELSPNAAAIKGMPLEALRRRSSHAALLVATRIDGESLAPINAQFFDSTIGPPVLQVAGMHHAFLAAQAAAGAIAKLACRYRREPAESFNLAAQVAGAGRPVPALYLLTPRTGWWESTAERGGGLVALLAGLAVAASLRDEGRLARDVRAFATCGHELGHVGLHALLATEGSVLDARSTWLHLGANLGCASRPELTLRASIPAEAEAMRALLIDAGYPDEHVLIEPISTASGEARDVVEHGGKVLSLIGRNGHFHCASDRWPGNVSVTRATAITSAVSRWVAAHAMR